MALAHAAESPHVSALVTWSAIGSVHRWPEDTLAEWRRSGKLDVVNARTGDVLPLYTDVLDDIKKNAVQRLDLIAAARKLTVPWLMLHGDADETVPLAEAHRLCEAASSTVTTLKIMPGATHTLGARHPWAGWTAALKMAMEETVGWFSRCLI